MNTIECKSNHEAEECIGEKLMLQINKDKRMIIELKIKFGRSLGRNQQRGILINLIRLSALITVNTDGLLATRPRECKNCPLLNTMT